MILMTCVLPLDKTYPCCTTTRLSYKNDLKLPPPLHFFHGALVYSHTSIDKRCFEVFDLLSELLTYEKNLAVCIDRIYPQCLVTPKFFQIQLDVKGKTTLLLKCSAILHALSGTTTKLPE